jgi:DNA-binding IclR family transcriptional regulator
VIRSQLDPLTHPAQRYERSQDEVLLGIASIAVPLVIPGSPPSALAVLYLPHVVDHDGIADALTAAAARIVMAVGG